MKRIIQIALAFFLIASSFAGVALQAQAPADAVIKGSSSTLYYHANGGRYVFPNEETYRSWFTDFAVVQTVSDADLGAIPLRGLVPYRPGIRLVKITSDPKTYAVDREGLLRWVKSEEAARALYGESWNQNIDDVPDAFFFSYRVGEPINGLADFNPNAIAQANETVNAALGMQAAPAAPVSDTEPGRVMRHLSGDLAPDLIPLAPYDLRFQQQGDRLLLRFTSTFWNRGDGDFILTSRDNASTTDDYFDTYQRIPTSGGGEREANVGQFFWHAEHDHYHYDDFADYTLAPARANSAGKTPPSVTQKTTFCMRDDDPIDLTLPGASQHAKYLGCDRILQGVSIGWADVYPWTLPDQYLDVTNVLPGVYSLSFDIDPLGRFIEKASQNNRAAVIVRLNPSLRTLEVLASASPFETDRNFFNDDLLVREEDDETLYLMQNNVKRPIVSDEALASYGYQRADAYVLPDDTLTYIQSARLIRQLGTETVFILNDHGYKRRVLNPEVLGSYASAGYSIIDISASEFASYPDSDLLLKPGTDEVYSVSSRSFVGRLSGQNPERVHRPNAVDFKAYAVDVISTGHEIPWDIAFLPNGDMLLTERTGIFRRTGSQRAEVRLNEVLHTGEGGLMGIAVHPDFESNSFIYLYYTTNDGTKQNRIERFRLEGDRLTSDRIILEGIPAALYHDGGQIEFGPDGMLYVTTGDASQPQLSQDRNSLAGKTLRMTAEGKVPSDNPFGTLVWAMGHRNAQGMAWDEQGRMWQTEHGRSGALSGYDELNLVQAGNNYGWPDIQGDETAGSMKRPVRHSGANTTWAPAGIAYDEGSLFFAGLRGETLYEAVITADGRVSEFREHLKGEYGRLRAVTVGPDGHLYVSTSNRDGRAAVKPGDDKLLRVYPDFL